MSTDKNAKDSDHNIHLDAMGIPILEEVIETEDSSIHLAPDHGLHLPKHDLLLSALKFQLNNELQAELKHLVNDIAKSTARELSLNLEAQIREQLLSTMEKRLSALIDQTLKQPPSDK